MRTIEERILNVKGIDYIVREDGKIFSTHNRGRAKYHQEIKQRMNSDGYMCITVGKTGNRTVASVHRLVAKAFIPNPLNLPEVNHKDYNRTNNSVDNLEWCSHKENIDYTLAAGRHASQTLDYSGKKNPNYGNTTLSQKYKADPAYSKEKQSRPGGQNGRAIPVCLLDKDKNVIATFPYMQLCAEYVLKQLHSSSSPAGLAGRIPYYIETGNIYKHTYYFSKDNTVLSLNNEKSSTTIESIAYEKYLSKEASRVPCEWNPRRGSAEHLYLGDRATDEDIV